MKTLQDQSRAVWSSNNVNPTFDELNAGSLQRIADATEKMAQNHIHLMADRDRYKNWYDGERRLSFSQRKTIAALRGQITKLKKQLHPEPKEEQ